MKPLSSLKTSIILWASVLCSWLAFPFLTYSGGFLLIFFFPLLIFIAQIILTLRFKKKNLLWLVVCNPVTFLALFNTINASMNYISGRPTHIHYCYILATSPTFDSTKMVYLDYYDDDCD